MEMTGNETIQRGRPPLPRRAFKIVNPLIKLVLRSPFHRLLSDNFIVLTFQGRKSGRMFSTPVGYTLHGDVLLVFTFSNWWKNLQANPDVAVRLQGQERTGRATLSTDPQEIAAAVNLILDKRGDAMGQRLGFQRIPANASQEEIREKSQHLLFFHIELGG